MNSFRNTIKSKILAYLSKGLLNLILKTCHIHIHGLEDFVGTANKGPCILMLWHNRLLIMGYILANFTKTFSYSAFVSNSKEGRILAAFVDSYQRGRAIKVAHNARAQALKTLIQDLKNKNEVALITPDGPRGPKYKLKPGIIKAAEATSASTISISWSATTFWQLPTWDNLILPKPFSTIHVVFGKEILASEPFKFKQELDNTTRLACQLAHRWPL
ncbi:MAG: lysophospholipid acyltransferase family protein [Parachlamydiaceae bacterium]